MAPIRFQYVDEVRDRDGRVRRYFRRAGHKRVPLPGLPGSTEFMEAYQTALNDAPDAKFDAGGGAQRRDLAE